LKTLATIGGARGIYHMSEAPNGQLVVADFAGSELYILSPNGGYQAVGGAFIYPAAVAFYSLDVAYSACNPAPLASRALCFSGSSTCPFGSEGVDPGNQSGVTYPRYILNASGAPTSPTFFVSNGGTGEIVLTDPVRRTISTVATGFTKSSGVTDTTRGPEQIAYDAAAQRLYVVDSGQNAVIAVDRNTGAKTNLRTGLSLPFGLILMPNGNLLVSNRGDGSLDEFTTSGTEVAHYDTGLGPNVLRGLTVTVKGAVYLLNDKTQTVYSVVLTPPVVSAPQLSLADAAGYGATAVAPGSIAAAFGSSLSTAMVSASSATLPQSLGGTSITVKDKNNATLPADLFFVSPGQANFVVPAAAPGGAGTVAIVRPDGSTVSGTVQISNVAPGLFSANGDGKGAPAATLLRVHSDGSQSLEAVAQLNGNSYVPLAIPAGATSDQLYLSLFGTGIRGRSALTAVGVNVGPLSGTVLYAGPQGAYEGLDQVNVLLPPGLQGMGLVNLVLSADGQTANILQLNFQ
jgi:uncharacterized protein (TIGR03437 family)